MNRQQSDLAEALAERADDVLSAYFSDDPKKRDLLGARLEALDDALDEYREGA